MHVFFHHEENVLSEYQPSHQACVIVTQEYCLHPQGMHSPYELQHVGTQMKFSGP